MSVTASRAAIAAAVLLVLGVVNWSIHAKENIRTHGDIILLQLAPVDPRSLMQGDYMALRFSLAAELSSSAGGSAPLHIDENRVATLARGAPPGAPRIRYRLRNGQVWLGTNAYFFEEGTAQRFEKARYGEFRLDRHTGEAVLVGLRDEAFKSL
jgi:uncharacterized membrane-anchored protein